MLAGRRQLSLDESSRRRLRRQPSEVRPILAWQDSTDSLPVDKPNSQVEVVAKKIGQPKPTPTRPLRSPSIRAESCLTLSRRQVAERLRVGWSKAVAKEGQDKGRQNLNIFLNKSFESRPESPRTPELGNDEYRRSQSFLQYREDCENGISDTSSETDSSDDDTPKAVLDPPAKPAPQQPVQSPTPPPPRQPPLSASARRAVFKATGRQKPTTCSPEPRPRLMSAPPQPPPRPPSAERSRSAPPRRPRRGAKAKPRRGVEGGEVITMVSLVSPAESEEEEPTPNVQCPPTPEVPPSPERAPVISNPPPPPILSLRRPPKAVTFKPGPSEGPQYRTSYPNRTTTVAQESTEEKKIDDKETSAQNETGNEKPQNAANKISTTQPKIMKALKPALVRVTNSQEKREDIRKKNTYSRIPEPIKEEIATEIVQKIETLKLLEEKDKDISSKDNTEEEGKKTEGDPDFKSAKERECWQLFKRVSSRGVSVSFETVLRGLLTPTEYRMRRAALLASC